MFSTQQMRSRSPRKRRLQNTTQRMYRPVKSGGSGLWVKTWPERFHDLFAAQLAPWAQEQEGEKQALTLVIPRGGFHSLPVASNTALKLKATEHRNTEHRGIIVLGGPPGNPGLDLLRLNIGR